MIEIAKYIDHTLLKPDTTQKDIEKICQEALTYQFASVCIQPTWVLLASRLLHNTNVKVCTVIGFPLGAVTTETKVFETKEALSNGATEIDMVINIGMLKDKRAEFVREDIRAVVKAAKEQAITKVILETCLLTKEEIVLGCQLAAEAGADFVKTSTGFSSGGAKLEDVKLMRKTVGPSIGVKASGGVKTKEDAQLMIAAGANRIGTSSGIAIVQGRISTNDY